MDKKGAIVIQVIGFVFIAFFVVLFLGVFIYGLQIVDSAFTNLNFTIGDVNSSAAYEDTLKQGIDAILVELKDKKADSVDFSDFTIPIIGFIAVTIVGLIFLVKRRKKE